MQSLAKILGQGPRWGEMFVCPPPVYKVRLQYTLVKSHIVSGVEETIECKEGVKVKHIVKKDPERCFSNQANAARVSFDYIDGGQAQIFLELEDMREEEAVPDMAAPA